MAKEKYCSEVVELLCLNCHDMATKMQDLWNFRQLERSGPERFVLQGYCDLLRLHGQRAPERTQTNEPLWELPKDKLASLMLTFILVAFLFGLFGFGSDDDLTFWNLLP